ncbi:organic cation transporter-like protein [Exaiptasia diaphana]|uniref:Uncharacterized protein n=1 Tax=Exaiptasia diaphana TaxID=2652724 RepID=A0A913YFF1_EXADI|nr:organic cation transporter-like protein [Exaiptasia diaphana]
MDDRVGSWSGHEYDDIFNHVKSCGRYQILLYGLISLQALPMASQFVSLVFATGTPGFHCVADNVTCPAKQCCDECTSYVFDGPFTSTVSEWKLICDRAYLGATINSCFFAGMLIGSFVTGMLSDAWGRQKCLFFCNAIMVRKEIRNALTFERRIYSIPFFAVLTKFRQIRNGFSRTSSEC